MLGFQVHVITDSCRGINLQPDDIDKAYQDMTNHGAKLVTSAEVRRG